MQLTMFTFLADLIFENNAIQSVMVITFAPVQKRNSVNGARLVFASGCKVNIHRLLTSIAIEFSLVK